MIKQAIKIKEIEPLLSQKIKDVYHYTLEHQLDKVSYKLFDRTLIIMLEGTITSPEKLLQENDCCYLAQQVRETIDEIIQPQIKEVIEDVLKVKVVDFLSDTTIDNNLTGAIAIFELQQNDNLNNYKF